MLPFRMRRPHVAAFAACALSCLSACAWQSEGAQVAVAYRTSQLSEHLESSCSGLVVVYSTTLNPCEQLARHSFNDALRAVEALVLPSAWAHAEAAPNRFAIPVMMGVHSDEYWNDSALIPGEGTYCSVTIEFAPADVDTWQLALHPEMLGRTLDIWLASDDNGETSVHSSEETEVVVDLSEPLYVNADTDVVMTIELGFEPLRGILDRGAKHATTFTELDVLAAMPPEIHVSITPRDR